MPQDHAVVLNYNEDGFSATPRTVRVQPGDTLVFALGKGPEGGKIRITIDNGEHFAPSRVQHGSDQKGQDRLRVAVGNGFKARTTYRCELLNKSGDPVLGSDGKPVAAEGVSGGEIVPVGD